MSFQRPLLIGGTGQLGSELQALWSEGTLIAPTHSELDLLDGDLPDKVRAIRPDVIFNFAAAHQVDAIEAEGAEVAFRTNTIGTGVVAKAAAELSAPVVFISTDYVFGHGHNQPIPVDASIGPVNIYGASKASGEQLVRIYQPNHLIIRTSGVFGGVGAGSQRPNFVKTMLRLAQRGERLRVVDDQMMRPTFARDLAAAILTLLASGQWGTYHFTNSGPALTWYEFAVLIFRQARLHAEIMPVSSPEYGARARRPAYSALDTSSLISAGLPEPHPVSYALQQYLKAM